MGSYIDIKDIKNVRLLETRRKFSFLIFIILSLFGFFPAIIYLIYYVVKRDDIFLYAIKYKDGTIFREEFSKDDCNLSNIRDIEANNFFN